MNRKEWEKEMIIAKIAKVAETTPYSIDHIFRTTNAVLNVMQTFTIADADQVFEMVKKLATNEPIIVKDLKISQVPSGQIQYTVIKSSIQEIKQMEACLRLCAGTLDGLLLQETALSRRARKLANHRQQKESSNV